MEDLAGAQNTKLLFWEKYPEKLQPLQLFISSTTWMTHNQNARMDVLQHVGMQQRKAICRPQGDAGRKTSEFTGNICAVPWRNPSQDSQVSKLKAGDAKSVGRNWGQVQIPKFSFACDLGKPRNPHSSPKDTAQGGGHWVGHRDSKGGWWCWSYWGHFH